MKRYEKPITEMTKTEIKEEAQDELLGTLSTAFTKVWEDAYGKKLPDSEKQILSDEMSKQMARIERLFGYTPYSFLRGS